MVAVARFWSNLKGFEQARLIIYMYLKALKMCTRSSGCDQTSERQIIKAKYERSDSNRLLL